MRSIALLDKLIAFPTVSRDPNRALIDFVHDLLGELGAEVTIIPDATGGKANLYATIGPTDGPAATLGRGRSRPIPVRSSLVERGVSVLALRAQGCGEEVPIADNRTAAGRAINRRIEFKF